MSDNENKDPQKTPNKVNFNSYWIYGIIILVILGINMSVMMNNSTKNISYTEFEEKVAGNKVERVDVINKQIAHVYLTPDALKTDMPDYQESSYAVNQPQYQFEIGDMAFFLEKMQNLKESGYAVPYKMETKTNWLAPIMSWLLPLFILVAIWLFIMKKVSGGGGPGGGQIFNIGKSKATLFDNKDSKVNVTFADVAGLNEAKEEVMEVVDFLKNPKKYTALGGKIPKGVLLVGPPGTGKTLLAKAVAGEAEVPFFSISGSDFVEMFVGVGASRVRDLFKQAREKAPCIIFIDEIDAIGRARGKGAVQGGNDERENTLNQLLVEMDGFSTDKGVILMAATNRPDILDSALMRPGRFDRQIGIDRPDLKGREAIFKVHLKNIKRSETMSPYELAEMTPGFAGAEIANVCNEAALIAARRGKAEVDMNDFNYALDRVIGGLEKKNKLIAPHEKEIIAYHEAGHAICGWYLEHASPLVKVTIVPRGMGTLGYAQYLPKEEYITRTEALLDRMCMTMGGRAAEKNIFNKISTGAQSDLDQVTKMAYSMVAIYGMNEKVGNVSFYGMQQDQFSKPYSDDTARLIDQECRKMIDQQYDRAQSLLEEKNKELHLLAAALLDKEVLTKSDVARLIGDSPFEDKNKPIVPNQPKVPENPSIDEVPSPDERV
ncbi:ATP-dependent zinc metalloprotease FtsH [Saprospiraceae bacterium]|nr:ATP-dependent zinc metalloprotease FtsH [Saprospiraceae bacterium]MDA9358001.1 ATP-dependent zinc metalloprotease FtsH [Saprospiraceae bacterium]MDB9914356.1 ATP-dependent zinc metalloprotease FtsH [Saprospiraceae bacterium]MDC1306309.1 ATP-dependent zinc metalloprotease FtsH [Saprospiraceae bacterium]MDC1308509.1 ATP-dependent zinc metalloprotease FtsH [Saprospiraceae bacterium]